MRLRHVLTTSAVVAMFASITAVSTANAAATRVVSHPAKVSSAVWLRTTKPSVAAVASRRAALRASTTSNSALGTHPYFSSDGGVLNGDLPKDLNASTPTVGTAPAFAGNEAGSGGRITSTLGLNAYDFASSHTPSYVAEPPDQGLCAGNGYVMEAVNMVMRVYKAGNLAPVSAPLALESFFGTPYAFGVQGGDYTVQGDVKCFYDAPAHRWLVSQLYIDFSTGKAAFMVAASTSSNPLGSYNVYSFDDTDASNPGCPCFGDQPLLGVNKDAVFISTNEFPIFSNGFNGANLYVIDKAALYAGSPSPTVWSDGLGLGVATPDAVCCWYSVQPAISPMPQSGTEFALSALDFVNAGDTRVAAWSFTNTQSIQTATPAIGVNYKIVNSEAYSAPPNGRQKAGTTPLASCAADPAQGGCGLFPAPTTVPEGPIASNDDRMNQVVYADGQLFSGVNTAMNVKGNLQAGIAYFIVHPSMFHGNLNASMTGQGYVAPKGQDVLFPSIGATADGNAVIAFTLTGPNNFPSLGYATLSEGGRLGPVKIAASGAGAQDGFTEYQGYPNIGPRWGDYSAAVADGSRVYFAAEMIQHANCAYTTFVSDPTCGGTRDQFANWGTGIGVVEP